MNSNMISNMNMNMHVNMQKVRKVQFAIKSDTMTNDEMNGFARRQIFNIDSSAKIEYKGPIYDNNGLKYLVICSSHDKGNEIIHNLNYKQFDKCETFGFWQGINGMYEAVIKDIPEGSTKRDVFLAMYKFGPISRISLSHSNPSVAWVVFIDKLSLENAIASETKIGANTVNVAAAVNNSKWLCIGTRPKNSTQFQVASQ